ncbi:hypothetical protein TNCT_356971 [Trichonephila clavata]|uniref:Uncharacterized protein n=1 Tax=Trichonephila clavata TaxID=2740835 RepID=A0A8X6LV08_TRICU|nr:hypothetical protein TNCT_356971 [Trichonephila clavata]
MPTVEEGFPLTGEEWKAACTLTTRTGEPLTSWLLEQKRKRQIPPSLDGCIQPLQMLPSLRCGNIRGRRKSVNRERHIVKGEERADRDNKGKNGEGRRMEDAQGTPGARKRITVTAIAGSQRVPFPLKYDSPLGFPFSSSCSTG